MEASLLAVGEPLQRWDLNINETNCGEEAGRLAKKLGSLLGDKEDVTRRMGTCRQCALPDVGNLGQGIYG